MCGICLYPSTGYVRTLYIIGLEMSTKHIKNEIIERKRSSGFCRIFTVAFVRLFKVRLDKC